MKLTQAEAAVFAAVYHHRNENRCLPADDMDRAIAMVASESGVVQPNASQVDAALENLIKLGILGLENGEITLEDERVIHGKWR